GAPPESVSRLSFEEQGYDRDPDAAPLESAALAAPPTPAPQPPPAVPHAPVVPSTGLRSRLERHAPAGAPPPMWGSAAAAGAAPPPPRAGGVMPAPPAATPALATSASAAEPASAAPDGDSTRGKLARLNDAYEDWFGFRYCVFVAGRSLEALVP